MYFNNHSEYEPERENTNPLAGGSFLSNEESSRLQAITQQIGSGDLIGACLRLEAAALAPEIFIPLLSQEISRFELSPTQLIGSFGAASHEDEENPANIDREVTAIAAVLERFLEEHPSKSMPLLLELLKDDNPTVRHTACLVIRNTKHLRVAGAQNIASLLSDLHPQVRQAAVYALSDMEEEATRFIPLILNEIVEPAWSHIVFDFDRSQILSKLLKAAPHSVTDTFEFLMKHPRKDVRNLVISIYRNLSELCEKDPPVRFSVVRFVERLFDEQDKTVPLALGFIASIDEVFPRLFGQHLITDNLDEAGMEDPHISLDTCAPILTSLARKRDTREIAMEHVRLLRNNGMDALPILFQRLNKIPYSYPEKYSSLSDLPSDFALDTGTYERVASKDRLTVDERERVALAELVSIMAFVDAEKVSNFFGKYLDSPNLTLRIAAITIIGNCGKAACSAVTSLITNLHHENKELVKAACDALRSLQSYTLPFIPKFLEIAPKVAAQRLSFVEGVSRNNPAWYQRWETVSWIVEGAARHDPTNGLVSISRQLSNEDAEVRSAAAVILGNFLRAEYQFREKKWALPTFAIRPLCQMIEQGDREERYGAARALMFAESELPLVTKFLTKALSYSDKTLARLSIRALGRLDHFNEDTLHELFAQLDLIPLEDDWSEIDMYDTERDEVCAAISNIGTRAPEKSLEVILTYLSDEKSTAFGALTALQEILAKSPALNGKIKPFEEIIRKLLDHSSVLLRERAFRLLPYFENPPALMPKIIESASWDSSFLVRDACHEVLGQIGEPRQDVLELLLFSLDQLREVNASFRVIKPKGFYSDAREEQSRSSRGVFHGLGALVGRDAAIDKVFFALVSDRELFIRESAAFGLLACNSLEACRPFLTTLLSDKEEQVRFVALNTLKKFGERGKSFLQEIRAQLDPEFYEEAERICSTPSDRDFFFSFEFLGL